MRRQHLPRGGLDRGAIAGGDARLIHQRAPHADEGGAGREIGGDVARRRRRRSGRTPRPAGHCAARGYAPARRPRTRETLHHIGAGGQRGAHLGGGQRAQHEQALFPAGAASAGSTQGATMKRAPAARQVSRGGGVGTVPAPISSAGRRPVRGSARRVGDRHGDLEDAQSRRREPLDPRARHGRPCWCARRGRRGPPANRSIIKARPCPRKAARARPGRAARHHHRQHPARPT